MLIHNLFCDQLDRYGEVDTVAAAWRTALTTLPATTTVVLNADDSAVAAMAKNSEIGRMNDVRSMKVRET